MAHTFEHDGVTVEYSPAIVKTRQKRGRILSKLMAAYGYVFDSPVQGQSIITEGEFDDMTEYAEHLSQSNAQGAAWWIDDNAAPDSLCASYEAFNNSDPELITLLRTARRAVQAPKKTDTNAKAT